jgi:hypothetical protein
MEEVTTVPPVDDQAAFDLGEMLGRRQAFGAIAGRCSAADAECLRRMRDQKLYLSSATSWNGFCPKFLGITSRHANRIIGHLEEFGPGYFELAQVARITPDQFRVIAPAVHDQQIHSNGQAIALIPQNAGRIAATVAKLRQEMAPKETPKSVRLPAVDRRCEQMLTEIREFIDEGPKGADKVLLRFKIQETIVALRAMDLSMGI